MTGRLRITSVPDVILIPEARDYAKRRVGDIGTARGRRLTTGCGLTMRWCRVITPVTGRNTGCFIRVLSTGVITYLHRPCMSLRHFQIPHINVPRAPHAGQAVSVCPFTFTPNVVLPVAVEGMSTTTTFISDAFGAVLVV